MRRAAWLGAWAVTTLAGGVVEACGGVSGQSDAGPDATQTDAGSSDGMPGNDASDGGLCPTYGGTNPVCQAVVTQCQHCGPSLSACNTANFTSECDTLANVFSAQYAAAAMACDTECGEAGTGCIQSYLADASPSTTQVKVAAEYCAQCSDAGAACVAQVVRTLDLVTFSDQISTEIIDTCEPDASTACNPLTFLSCAGGIIFGSIPKSPCDAGAD